tara:strand:+ start:58 stop:315 length:258 start_codon:yes stop_codon:yes gene_type:complete
MNREQLKNQVNSKIVNDELSEEEMMHDIMQMVDAHVTEQLRIGGVSQQRELLEAYTQFLWTQHNNLTNADNNKIALDKFIASNCR